VAKRVTVTFLLDDDVDTTTGMLDEIHDAVQDAQMPYNDGVAVDISTDVQEGVLDGPH
jgi:hypothetical protein